jgi:beta-N-acetylhexosaminidase
MIKLGLTVLLEDRLELIEGKSVGLITNSTGVNESLQDNIFLLVDNPQVKLKAIFSPEHGLWGSVQDAISIPFAQYDQVKIPIYSLYGKTTKPTIEMLDGIDALIFDIQDIGVRFWLIWVLR